MSDRENFPLFFPAECRRLFATEQVCRRLVHTAAWEKGSRVLELCGGSASSILAREFGCQMTAVDSDDKSLQALRERVKKDGLDDLIELRQVDFSNLPFGDAEFQGVIALGRVPLSAAVAAQSLRRLLAPRGRLALTYPVKVGYRPSQAIIDFWERKLGERLLLPGELLQIFERAGFEPECIDILSDVEVGEYYRELVPILCKKDASARPELKVLHDEFDLHRTQSGKANATYALAILRRKEPGEKPLPSREKG